MSLQTANPSRSRANLGTLDDSSRRSLNDFRSSQAVFSSLKYPREVGPRRRSPHSRSTIALPTKRAPQPWKTQCIRSFRTCKRSLFGVTPKGQICTTSLR
eukprot:1292480-Alexandrium_andersonii.AAC.1